MALMNSCSVEATIAEKSQRKWAARREINLGLRINPIIWVGLMLLVIFSGFSSKAVADGSTGAPIFEQTCALVGMDGKLTSYMSTCAMACATFSTVKGEVNYLGEYYYYVPKGWNDSRKLCLWDMYLHNANGNTLWAEVASSQLNDHSWKCPMNSTRIDYSACVCNKGYAPSGLGQTANGDKACRPVFEFSSTTQYPSCQSPRYGDPIFPLVGSERFTAPLGLLLGSLTYDSGHRPPVAGTSVSPIGSDRPDAESSIFGDMWFGTWNKRLDLASDLKVARVNHGDGSVTSFNGDGLGGFLTDNQTQNKLIRVGAGIYHYINQSDRSVEVYSTVDGGRVQKISYANGKTHNFSYGTATTSLSVILPGINLLKVTDENGREINFKYNNLGLVEAIAGPDGGKVSFEYAGNFLSKIIWQDTKFRIFEYLTGKFPWALTGVLDELGDRYAGFAYDADGRAIRNVFSGLVNDYQFTYTVGPKVQVTDSYDPIADVVRRTRTWMQPTGGLDITVRLPNGQTSQLRGQMVAGQHRLVSQSQPAGSGCAASSSQMSYDAQGNVESQDAFDGKRVCYSHDLSRNLEASRVEGLASGTACSALIAANAVLPANSRKVSTQWHPDWRLERRVAEPGRITTYVYNGQTDPTAGNAIASCAPSTAKLPDGKPIAVLCKKVEQATTDFNGAAGFAATAQAGVPAREWKYTYNNFGQILTEDGPRTDVADVTTYTYHAATAFTGTDPNAVGVTMGDLKTVTNAAGTTQYIKYNKHGQLLESIDPNGVVSSYSYDLRQRLLSATVGGQQTSYAYDAIGQLKKVTRPDTSWTGYDYDRAHRLVATYDNLGNRVDYTLDEFGNRTAEDIKDPGGVLMRQVTRSIDPLGRVQRTTGRE